MAQGYDARPEHLEAARMLGAVEDVLDGPRGAFDVLLLAVPPLAALELLRADWRAGLWLDTGSVKRPICERAQALGRPLVGGHPLAGNAGSGPAAAARGLFAGRGFALCDAGGPRTLAEELVRSLGAQPFWIEAGRHDQAVAASSHLCYAVSCALALLLRDLPQELLGPAAQEMLRVATSPPALWQEILQLNAPGVDEAAGRFWELLREAAAGSADVLSAARTAACGLRGCGEEGHG